MSVELSWLEVVMRVAGAIATVGSGVFAWLYLREKGGQMAQDRLNDVNASTISAYETRVRLLQLEVDSLTRELAIAQATLAEMRNQLIG